jgi:hypothetical protein
MKKIIILFLFITSLFSEQIGDLKFSNDYKKIIKQAKKENKRVYMLITSSSCGWCRKFENETLPDWTVAENLEKYLLLHIDRDKDFIPSTYDKKRVPRHYFLTSDAHEIYSFLGYRNIDDFNSNVNDVEWQYKDKLKKGTLIQH